MWRLGSKLTHPFNPELGIGIVRKIEGRFLTVYFPMAERELTLAAEGGGLSRLVMPVGGRVRVLETDEDLEIAEVLEHGYRLRDGREVADAEIWPLAPPDTPLERLASGRLDSLASFQNRLDGLRLARLREAGGLGSFLGGRIELFPHQLYTALRAVEADPVRWLLADEVGLGKTIEACLILSALVRTGRAERALVVAPSTLTVQWLGELYRKFHQVFVLLDRERLDSVATDIGEDANPFDVHPFAVISLELLAGDARLREQAESADCDLIVLDEAHRLATPEQHKALSPLVAAAKHALLLTATPLQADGRAFHRLLKLLHPKRFKSFKQFERTLESGDAVVPCTSAVRRADVGGLPPREPVAVDLPAPGETLAQDPRAEWLASQVRGWAAAGEKALVFVHDRELLETLREYLESTTQTRVTVFHEDMSVAKRDIEVAAFRETALPLLLSSDAGSEGRNFQFCDRMVLYDLPRDPVVLEQRIGRLDRIGRSKPVEIVYFLHPDAALDVAGLFEKLDLFARPAAGLDAALGGVAAALESAEATGKALDVEKLLASVEKARKTAGRKLDQVFYRDAYDHSRDEELLALIPDDLESLTRRVCLGAAEDLGLEVVEKGGESLYYIELGANATVDSLPGVPGGARFLGSFDRREAVCKDEVDFFSNGHSLVEGLLLELEDGTRGRATLFELSAPGCHGAGLLLVYKDGPDWHAVVVDADGSQRRDWVRPILAGLPGARDISGDSRKVGPSWAQSIQALGAGVKAKGTLIAAAFFRFR